MCVRARTRRSFRVWIIILLYTVYVFGRCIRFETREIAPGSSFPHNATPVLCYRYTTIIIKRAPLRCAYTCICRRSVLLGPHCCSTYARDMSMGEKTKRQIPAPTRARVRVKVCLRGREQRKFIWSTASLRRGPLSRAPPRTPRSPGHCRRAATSSETAEFRPKEPWVWYARANT